MAGLDPAIQSLFASPTLGGWMAASRAAMTERIQNRPLSGGEKRPAHSNADVEEMGIPPAFFKGVFENSSAKNSCRSINGLATISRFERCKRQ
jgi:hypothetical protein